VTVEEHVLAARLGAASTLAGKELLDWLRRPRFRHDFEGFYGRKPYVRPYVDPSATTPSRVKYLRLSVKNAGGFVAKDCGAKLEIWENSVLNPEFKLLHWARHDPGMFHEAKEQFAPVSINKGATEQLNLILLYEGQRTNDVIIAKTVPIPGQRTVHVADHAHRLQCRPRISYRGGTLGWYLRWFPYRSAPVGPRVAPLLVHQHGGYSPERRSPGMVGNAGSSNIIRIEGAHDVPESCKVKCRAAGTRREGTRATGCRLPGGRCVPRMSS